MEITTQPRNLSKIFFKAIQSKHGENWTMMKLIWDNFFKAVILELCINIEIYMYCYTYADH